MRRVVLIGCLIIASLVGCRPTQTSEASQAVTISLAVDPVQPMVGDATLKITVLDAQGYPINNAKLDIRGDMTHAGMMPVLRNAELGTDGVYTVPFEWTMSGDWFVEVKAILTDGTTKTQIFNYTVSQ